MTRSAISRCVKIFSLVAIVATFVLGAIGVKPDSASAAADVQMSTDVAFTLVDPCSGKSISFIGTIHTVTKDAGFGFGDGIINGSSLKGVSSDGTSYVLTYKQGSALQIGSAFVQSIDVTYNVISQGSAANSQLKLRYHATVSPTGQLTVHDVTVISC